MRYAVINRALQFALAMRGSLIGLSLKPVSSLEIGAEAAGILPVTLIGGPVRAAAVR
jgi:hypothetical protein